MNLTRRQLLDMGYPEADLDRAIAAAPAPPKARPAPPKARPAAPARRALTLLAPGAPGRWDVELAGWVPPSLNDLLGRHWGPIARRKRLVAHRVGVACLAARVARAEGRRRVSLEVRLPAGRTHPDEDNVYKLLRDALVACGALADDAPEWIETGPYAPTRGRLATVVTLEDLEV